MKTTKVSALAGLLVLGGLNTAQAQALTSSTTVAAESPMIVGIGSVITSVQVSSTVSSSLSLQIPNPRTVVGVPSCVTYDTLGQGPKPLRYTFNATTGVVVVQGSTMTSGTLELSDQVRCTAVVRP